MLEAGAVLAPIVPLVVPVLPVPVVPVLVPVLAGAELDAGGEGEVEGEVEGLGDEDTFGVLAFLAGAVVPVQDVLALLAGETTGALLPPMPGAGVLVPGDGLTGTEPEGEGETLGDGEVVVGAGEVEADAGGLELDGAGVQVAVVPGVAPPE